MCLFVCLAWAANARAQQAENAPKASEDEAVTVVGRRDTPSRGASDFNLKLGELSRVPRANAADILKLAPGILLTNKGGDGHAEQVFLRGFDAREGQDIVFSGSGVPIPVVALLFPWTYTDLHFIIPELVEGLRVIEGPFDPRQGNFAVAGSFIGSQFERVTLSAAGRNSRLPSGCT